MSDSHSADDFPSSRSDAPDPKTSACDEYAVAALRYLNHDLAGDEAGAFRSHLASCENCQTRLEKERTLSQLFDRSRPLYSAPAALRAHVNALTEQTATPENTGRSWRRGLRVLAGISLRVPRVRVLAPATLAMAVCLAFAPSMVRHVRAASYVETAVSEHRSYLKGDVPVGFRSGSPQQVTMWFAGKVPFSFRLPSAEASPESRPVYRLTGASIVRYKDSPAALVMYETQNEKISLLIAPSKSAVIAGGDEVRSGRLIFHYRTDSGFKVITWSNHDLSYALVSSVSGPARQSCLVCHQSMADHEAFRISR